MSDSEYTAEVKENALFVVMHALAAAFLWWIAKRFHGVIITF